MIASRRWSVAIGWVLLFTAAAYIGERLAPIKREDTILTLAAYLGLLIIPFWIMFCAHQLGYIRGATNDLSGPEQRIVLIYKKKVENKARHLADKAKRWT